MIFLLGVSRYVAPDYVIRMLFFLYKEFFGLIFLIKGEGVRV